MHVSLDLEHMQGRNQQPHYFIQAGKGSRLLRLSLASHRHITPPVHFSLEQS